MADPLATDPSGPTRPSGLNSRDWRSDLGADERLLWSGRPTLAPVWLMAALTLVFCAIAGPAGLLILVPAGILVGLYGRNAYALTDQRILVFRHPLRGQAKVESLNRAGTYPNPYWTSSSSGLTFTAPSGQQLKFAMLSRRTVKELIALYAQSQGSTP